MVAWSFGRPHRAFSVLYPDGTRGEVDSASDHGFRRRSTGEKRWIYGKIDIQPNDVVFTDGPQPTYTPPPQTDVPDLEADLARDPAFLEAIQDDRFARAVYNIFSYRPFLKGTDERAWHCGGRDAASLVADLRGLGESYQDYYLDHGFLGCWPDDRSEREARLRKEIEELKDSQDERDRMRLEWAEQSLAEHLEDKNADVFDALHAHVTRLGWHTLNAEDKAKDDRRDLDQRVGILRKVKSLEGRRLLTAPQWAVPFRQRLVIVDRYLRFPSIRKVPEAETLSMEEREAYIPALVRKRLYLLAVTGRISKDDFDTLNNGLGRRYPY